MAFDTRRGTRGRRSPSGPLFRLLNRLMSRRIRRSGGQMGGSNFLILGTVGAKSRIERKIPITWFPGPDGSYLIVAAAAGAAGNPAWYHNLAAHPDQVTVEIGDRTIAVTPEQLHGPERDQAWQQIITASRRYASFQDKTDRLLPIIRLTPRT